MSTLPQNNTLIDTMVSAAEKLDWTCEQEEYANGAYIRFGICSPAGEDFSISVPIDRIVRGVRDATDSFDVDEHVTMWLDAARHGTGGVPTARILVEDAEQIKSMLNELADTLEEARDRFQQGKSLPLDAKLTDATSRSIIPDIADRPSHKKPTR